MAPSPGLGRACFWAQGFIVIGLWTAALGRSIPRALVPGTIVVSLATVAVLLAKDAIYLHEAWAGFLIAASLASWSLRRVGLSIGFGLLAMLFRELAVPYVLAMAVLALGESKRREALAWTSALLVFAVFWTWHLWQVIANMPADGLHNSWLVAGGWPFVLTASRSSVFLMLLPAWVVAVLVPIAWAGCWRWTDGTGLRVATMLTGYFLMFMLVGRADNWYWGFLVGPLIPLGFFGYFFDPARTRAA